MSDSIWDWVYDYLWTLNETNEVMSEKLENFSSLAYAKNQDEVEASFPELLAFAREQENKWLEVFLRHWRLQAYVNTQLDPRPLVPEVLDLLALTQTDEAAGACPQATCVIDDLNDIYSGIDAAGFAQERHELLKEQMETLSPSRECYMCMSVGMVDVLCDMNKPQEALSFWKDACKSSTAITEAMQQGSHFDTYISESFMRAHIGAGDYESALTLMDAATPKDENHANRVELLKVIALMGQGKTEPAKALFTKTIHGKPDDLPVDQTCRTANDLMKDGHLQADPKIVTVFENLADRSRSRGRIREAFDACDVAAHVSLLAGDANRAKAALGIMRELLPEFNRPAGANLQIEHLETAMSGAA